MKTIPRLGDTATIDEDYRVIYATRRPGEAVAKEYHSLIDDDIAGERMMVLKEANQLMTIANAISSTELIGFTRITC